MLRQRLPRRDDAIKRKPHPSPPTSLGWERDSSLELCGLESHRDSPLQNVPNVQAHGLIALMEHDSTMITHCQTIPGRIDVTDV